MIANGDAVAVTHAVKGVRQRLHAAAIVAFAHATRFEAGGLEAMSSEKIAEPRVARAADAVACRVSGEKLAARHPWTYTKPGGEPAGQAYVVRVIVRDDDAPDRTTAEIPGQDFIPKLPCGTGSKTAVDECPDPAIG